MDIPTSFGQHVHDITAVDVRVCQRIDIRADIKTARVITSKPIMQLNLLQLKSMQFY